MEAAGQHVDEEAADELVDRECHHFGAAATLGAVVLPFEGHARLVERDQAAVGDGDAVGIARQIGQHRLGPTEWSLRVDYPLGLTERRQMGGERLALRQSGMVAEELQAPGVVRGGERLQDQPTEQPREHADGEEEAGPA